VPHTPGFPVRPWWAGKLHAAFLSESRTRAAGRCYVQEILTAFLRADVGNARILSVHPSGIGANSCRYTEKVVKFPTSPRKNAVRYGAPALVVEKSFAVPAFFRKL
jgi:hypothetical protein